MVPKAMGLDVIFAIRENLSAFELFKFYRGVGHPGACYLESVETLLIEILRPCLRG